VALTVSLIQHASGLDPAANRRLLDELTPTGVDVVVFPEAFARDFGPAGSDVSDAAEPVTGPFATEVARVAAERGTTVLAGMFETSEDPGRPWNTLVLRGAAVAEYRKVHLYDSFGYKESERLSAGPIAAVTAPLKEFTLGLMTCYDLRFPEQARALVDAGADVLVAPSAWVAGERKVDHWRTLVRARAIENTTYVVAVGQPIPRYTGHSMVVDPLGDILVEAGEGPEILTATLEPEVIVQARRTNPSLANRRR
jgi:deaminated glutathione amidase